MTGHCEDNRYVEDVLEVLSVENYAELTGPDGNRPLIFLNACQAGRGGYKLTGTGGFAQAFLNRGAGGFVGALWSVGDSPALTFAEEFYTALRSGNKNFSEAAIEARKAAKVQNDPTWLSYTVYGHPHGVLCEG
jgi:CHAT domain-containing protein